MKEILPFLESSESIWRYSWFTTRFPAHENNNKTWWLDKAISLLEEDSPKMTELGEFYNEFSLESIQ